MYSDLKRIATRMSERRGWDFSSMRVERDPVPWDYPQVVRRYLRSSDRVLDLGTGGGEMFLSLAGCFDRGVGIDISPEMIAAAKENTPPHLKDKLSFHMMRTETIEFPDDSFDVVLNRHSVTIVEQVARLLRSGGYFITQQVGPRNTQNICQLFGCGVGGEYGIDPSQQIMSIQDAFQQKGWHSICMAEYDVRYIILDIESLLFWLNAIPIPQDFNLEKHWRQVETIITRFTTQRGIETNEHRQIYIAQKP